MVNRRMSFLSAVVDTTKLLCPLLIFDSQTRCSIEPSILLATGNRIIELCLVTRYIRLNDLFSLSIHVHTCMTIEAYVFLLRFVCAFCCHKSQARIVAGG
jgi:hypothetical protein